MPKILSNLALSNHQGQRDSYGFNERLHGETGYPMGFSKQGWSAVFLLYGAQRKLPLFDDSLAAKAQSAVVTEVNEA